MTSLDELLTQHPERSLTPLAELSPDEHGRYLRDFKKRSRPVILRGYHRHDPALATWSIRGLIDRLPEQSVDLDVGDAMVSDGLTFEVESLHRYLESVATHEGSTDEGSTDEGSTDEGSTDEGSTDEPVRYLQGFDIFAHDPTLYDEIGFPHLGQTAVRQVRAGWIGPAGTVTGYHADIGDNQLSQIVGRKLVKFVSPDQADRVYRTRKYDPNGIACAVDADAWDRTAHPRFADTDALYAVLEPGDSVFIPGGWFHYVRSLDASISVNHVGYTARQMAVGKTLDQIRRLLHNRGLYGTTCTCHMIVDGQRVARR